MCFVQVVETTTVARTLVSFSFASVKKKQNTFRSVLGMLCGVYTVPTLNENLSQSSITEYFKSF